TIQVGRVRSAGSGRSKTSSLMLIASLPSGSSAPERSFLGKPTAQSWGSEALAITTYLDRRGTPLTFRATVVAHQAAAQPPLPTGFYRLPRVPTAAGPSGSPL